MTNIKASEGLVEEWADQAPDDSHFNYDREAYIAGRAIEWALQQRQQEWPEPIKDRRPTEADGDRRGEVLVLTDIGWIGFRWNRIDPSDQWLHTPSWRPKSPSLKVEALAELDSLQDEINKRKLGWSIKHGAIGKALQAMKDDEHVPEPVDAEGPGSTGEAKAETDKCIALGRRIQEAILGVSLSTFPPEASAAMVRAVASWIECQETSGTTAHTAWEAAEWLRAEAKKLEEADA